VADPLGHGKCSARRRT